MLAALIILAAGTAPAHAMGTPIPVKTTKAFEWAPTASNDGTNAYFAWTQNILGRPNAPDSAFVQMGTATAGRINPGGTYGFLGDFDAGTSKLVYQQARGPNSEIRLFDASTHEFLPLPSGINNPLWQWDPSIDTDETSGTTWILYGENVFTSPTAPWRLYLYNAATQRKRILDTTTNRCGCLAGGGIAYPWVVWSKGLTGDVWRYNIETKITNKVVLPRDRDEYYASVMSDGTVYVAQAGDRCGVRARLWRVDPTGTATLVYALASGSEPLTISTFDTGAGVTLYSDRYFCRAKTSNIFRIDNADTVTLQREVTTVGDGLTWRAATPLAWPHSPRSSLHCEASGRCRPALRADAGA